MNSSKRRFRRTLHTAATASLAGALAFSMTGCKHNGDAANNGQDPADANMAQPYTGAPGSDQGGTAQVAGQTKSYTPQSSGESYESQAPAPIIRQAPAGSQPTQYYPVPQAGNSNASYQQGYDTSQQGYDNGQQAYDNGQQAYNQGYTDAEEAGEQALAETDQAPPPLPEYDQPPAPEDDYIWTPGYWNYASTGYYWVPGVWCAPPFIGALWTPPWWGYYHSHYLFHRGYWGPHIGYYGGVNYGFGYIGTGYFGGYWNHRDFYYNRAVTNVNINVVHNYYQRTVVYNNITYGPHTNDRISYNGGPHGLTVQPRPYEIAAMHEAHYAPVAAQRANRVAAADNRSQFFAANHGRPAEAFSARPIGAVHDIPAAPREQAFNHPGPQPGLAGRPGVPNPAVNRPADAHQPFAARPGAPVNAPAFHGRPGEPNQPAPANRPGAPGQPGGHPFTPGAQPNQPRPGEGFNYGRPNNEVNRPAPAEAQPRFNGNRPAPTPAQPRPNVAQPRPEQPRPEQPRPEQPRPEQARPEQARPEQPRPEQARPEQPRPEQARPAQPQFEARPQPQMSRPAPTPRPAPMPHAVPAARPAPAPHPGGGGGEHGHPH